jgi:hypothetical protein
MHTAPRSPLEHELPLADEVRLDFSDESSVFAGNPLPGRLLTSLECEKPITKQWSWLGKKSFLASVLLFFGHIS